MFMGTTEGSNKKLNDLPAQYRFPTLANLQSQLNAVSKKVRTSQQILYNDGALVGPACGCFVFGIDYNTGDLYYKDINGQWALAASGGGVEYDATVDFSVNADPNNPGTTFNPNTPNLTTVIYVSTIDGSQWTYNGLVYTLYIAPYWAKTGNSGITSAHFIGTTNNADVIFKRNNVRFGRLGSGAHTSFGQNAGLAGASTNITAFGANALTNATGTNNSAFGISALGGTTTGTLNLGIGANAGLWNTTGSEQIFINTLNRGSYVFDQTRSPIYIQQHTTVSSQLIDLNAGITTLRGDTTAAKLRFLEPSGSGTNYTEFQAVAQGANITYSLPPAVGAAGTVLTDVAGNGVLTWAAGGSGANTALSNLAAVAINTSLISDTDNTDDLGSAAIAWKDVYLRRILLDGATSGTVTVQPAGVAGTWTLTLPTTDGNSGELLQTDGSGATSWVDTTTYFSNRFGGDGSLGNPITPIKVTTTASSATPTPDADASTMFTVTALAANAVFAAPTGTPVDGQDLLIRIKDNATPRTLGWNAIYRAGTDFALPTTTVASETMYIQFIYNAADATWDAIGLTQGF